MDQRSPARSGRGSVRHPRESSGWSRAPGPPGRRDVGATASRLPPVRVRAALLVVLAALLALALTAPARPPRARSRPAGCGVWPTARCWPAASRSSPSSTAWRRRRRVGADRLLLGRRPALRELVARCPPPNRPLQRRRGRSRPTSPSSTAWSPPRRRAGSACCRWSSARPPGRRLAARQPAPRRPPAPRAYARFLTALVHRYGPTGSFWGEHPELHARARCATGRSGTSRTSPATGPSSRSRALRAAAARGPNGDQGRRPGRPRRALRPRQLLLARAAGDLPGRRPRALRHRRGAPVHQHAAPGGEDRPLQPRRDAQERRRAQAHHRHRADLVLGQGQDAQHLRLGDHRARPGERG